MKIINIPGILYLQIGEDENYFEDEIIDFKKGLDHECVTWCTDNIFNNDMQFFSKEFIVKFTTQLTAKDNVADLLEKYINNLNT